MRKGGPIALVLVVAGSILWGGCRTGAVVRNGAGGPKDRGARVAAACDDVGGLKAYLAEGAPARRTFQQIDTASRGASSQAYEREVQTAGRVEGSLIGRVELPLDQFLDPHSRGVARPSLAWPASQSRKLDAFFIEFKPPLMEWPMEADEGQAVEARAQITAYEHDGVPFANGTVRRTMRAAGYETIRAGDQSFDDAVRMEADSKLIFGWLATIRVHETAWFARDVGLVRREERFSGRALWLFRFQGGSRYELAEEVLPPVEMVSEVFGNELRANGLKADNSAEVRAQRSLLSANQGYWSRLAICFERSGRRIQLSGLAVEWAGARESTSPR